MDYARRENIRNLLDPLTNIPRARTIPRRYAALAEGTNTLAENTDYLDEQCMKKNANNDKTGEYFYNLRDKNSNGKIPRIFDKRLLEMTRDNPFSRRLWDDTLLRKKTIKNNSTKKGGQERLRRHVVLQHI